MSGNCRLCPLRSLPPVRICFFPISRNLERTLNLLYALCLVPFGCIRCRTLLVLFLMNFSCALCVLYGSTYLIQLLFCLVLVLFFVSPRNPSRPLSKSALSFFICDIISQASSSSSSSLAPSSSSSTADSSRSASSFRAHGVPGITISLAFSRNVPLSSVLEAATWSSYSVFTSFYLKDIQFSSARGFSLGPVVAAGCVV